MSAPLLRLYGWFYLILLATVSVYCQSSELQVSSLAPPSVQLGSVPVLNDNLMRLLRGEMTSASRRPPELARAWLAYAQMRNDAPGYRHAVKLLCAYPQTQSASMQAAQSALSIDPADVKNWNSVLLAHICAQTPGLAKRLQAMAQRFKDISVYKTLSPMWYLFTVPKYREQISKEIATLVEKKGPWRDAEVLYALILGTTGEQQRGLDALKKAPNSELVERTRLTLLYQLNNYKEIAKSKTCATSQEPITLHICRNALLGLSDASGALTLTQNMLEQSPFNANLHLDLGNLLIAMGKQDQADHALKIAAGLGHSGARVMLAKMSEQRGDKRAAINHYLSMEDGPGLTHGMVRAIELLEQMEQLPEALELLNQKLDDSGNRNSELLFMLGTVYIRMHENQQAISSFEQALQINPDHLYARIAYCYSLLQTNQREKALDLAERLEQKIPNHPDINNMLGYILAELNTNLPRARSLLEHALKTKPDNPAYLDSLGWVEYQAGNLKKSLELLETSWAMEKDSVSGMHLGQLLWRLNRPDDAERVWRQAAQIYPPNPQVENIMDKHIGK